MPEGPEVEVVRQQLLSKPLIGNQLIDIRLSNKALRKKLTPFQTAKLKKSRLKSLERKGKYLFFHFDNLVLMNHLGMTGKWRLETTSNYTTQIHDHYFFVFENKKTLIYNDARRFGMMQLLSNVEYKKLKNRLGWDPISDDLSIALPESVKSSKKNIKSILMDQSIFCGVGNIYASEILFLSQTNPRITAAKLTVSHWQTIMKVSKKILSQAVEKGGSTIQNYKNVNGQSGRFQDLHLVYGQENQPCKICKSIIKKIVLQQRSTFFCPKCQK